MNLDRPIALLTGFKAGTWMMRKTLKLLTGLEFYEAEIIPGEKKYYDHTRLHFIKDRFYSWHLIPTKEVVDILNQNNAKTIFVVRNIYDIVVSVYYYFYHNIDADIGRGNNKDTFLKQFSFSEGISLIITGFDENGLRWNGMSEIIDHYNKMFLSSKKCDALLISYEDLVENNLDVLKRIDVFLELNTPTKRLEEITELTTFKSMKDEAKQKGVGEAHFRSGKAGKNKEELSLYHKIQLRQIVKLTAPDFYQNADEMKCQSVYLI